MSKRPLTKGPRPLHLTEPAPLGWNTSTATALPAGPIIFVIGPPGSGKGTLCSRICEEFPGRFKHLSVGDYLRDRFIANASEDVSSLPSVPGAEEGCLPPDEITRYVEEGRLLPWETVIPLIREKLLAEDPFSSTGWLIDGFPRDREAAVAFELIKAPTALIELKCGVSTARQRFLTRRRSSSDNEKRFEKRLQEYEDYLGVILHHYRELGFQMTADSDDDEWIKRVLDVFRDRFQGLLALTGPQEGA